MNFTILKTGGTDRERWRTLVEKLPARRRDLHYLPEYAVLYERAFNYEARLAWYGDDEQYVIQPFVVRPLNGLPFIACTDVRERFFDIAGVYGYGGPTWRAASPEDASRLFHEFDRHFTAYCKNEKFASEFCCLHPLIDNH